MLLSIVLRLVFNNRHSHNIFMIKSLLALQNCDGMFAQSVHLAGNATPIINALKGLSTLTSHSGAFTNCTSLSDYNSIPSDWK